MKNQIEVIGDKLHPYQQKIMKNIRNIKGIQIVMSRGAGKNSILNHLNSCIGCEQCSGGDENLQEYNDPLKKDDKI